ncbi:MAG: hypothetical protein HQM09_13150 [Candidatus Riflebacteria bacterium]|nr:hypothetical protein [Candidatus Riflebacteria bacterium]
MHTQNVHNLLTGNSKPRGIILPLVLIVLCVLGILVFGFSNLASHSQRMAFRSEQDEAAKCLLGSAIDETFFLFNQETGSSQNVTSKWLANDSDTTTQEWNLNKLPQTKSIAAEFEQSGGLKIASLAVIVSKRKEDFRNMRLENGVSTPYYRGEGHGTLVLRGTIVIAKAGRSVTALTLERHHDFKVICLVSDQKNSDRTKARNRCLDYALFVREGLKEFRDTAGRMLNNSNLSFEIKPMGQGKIYIGGTDDKDNYVFINLGPGQSSYIPQENAIRLINLAEAAQMGNDALTNDPDAKNKIDAEIKQGNWPAGTTPLSAITDELGKSSLKSGAVPFSPNPQGLEKDARDALFGDPGQTGNPKDNTEPGIKLLDTNDLPHQVIEGHLRQRFIYLVEINNQKLAQIQGTNKLLVVPSNAYVQMCQKQGQNLVVFIKTIFKCLENLTPAPLRKAVTSVDEELPFGSSLDSERNKAYSPGSIKTDYTPFSYFNLRSYAAADNAELTSLGILTPGGLNLRGATHVRSPIVIGGQGMVTVTGEGLLSTNQDIIIKNGITCKPDSMCVLWTKGNIVIDTTEKIEAGIIANEVVVNTGKALNLKGALFVNRLGSAKWPIGPHIIEYDAKRFYKIDSDVYSVSISPKISFIRMMSPEQ